MGEVCYVTFSYPRSTRLDIACCSLSLMGLCEGQYIHVEDLHRLCSSPSSTPSTLVNGQAPPSPINLDRLALTSQNTQTSSLQLMCCLGFGMDSGLGYLVHFQFVHPHGTTRRVWCVLWQWAHISHWSNQLVVCWDHSGISSCPH